ncbi:MAG: sigma-54 dependent transcriptional regulator [Planctomycetota bacterium]|nr:sigma-54 dependent transcriptional regulator [Planctomycetota bacterium]MDA1248473.1 sigma-54 dependent transcriptional regulator [Planctomycetota bacterium]
MSSSTNSQRLRVLFVDDEAMIREVMRIELPRMGHEVTVCDGGEAAIKAIDAGSFDAAIVDLKMPGIDGWQVVDHLRKVSPETQVIIHTAHGSMDEAIQALRRGANDFLQKPCKLVDIATVLSRVAEKRTLTNRTIALEKRLQAVEGSPQLIGETAPMQRVKKLIDKIAPTESSVLILGETGTGKELAARRIHEASKRSSMPFVAVNCGALPEQLVESELFGHRKGAFTGADSHRKGLIEVADGGTLFLDELGELDRNTQVKLLRFLESGEVRRIGENESFHVDVRIVCATNRPLQEMVDDGSFREDLYFRVNTFEIRLPSLRERTGDIEPLAKHLIERLHRTRKVERASIAADAISVLQSHPWKGNVRELANTIEYALTLCDGKSITAADLPDSLGGTVPIPVAGSSDDIWSADAPQTLRDIEMKVIYRVLDKHRGDKPRAASELGIALKTLYNKLNQYEAQSAAS